MNIMDMTVRDLFSLTDNQIRKIDYMTDSYEEVDSSLDEIPDKTLDDIMDEIKRENEEPVVDDDPEPTDNPTDDPEPEPEPTPEPDPDPDPEPEPEPEEPGPMDPYIDRCNVLITEINAERNNAIIANIMEHKVTEDDPTVISICGRVFCILGTLYSITNSVRSIFISDANTNKRALFMVDAYNALVDLTTLVNAIYNALNERAYLVQVNGPVEADLEHWNTEEVQNNLACLDVWIATDDNTKLSLIDEGIQFDLKYAALLKKLVICEFKGFDGYYDNLIKILCQMHRAMDNFTPEYNEMDPNEPIFYDPTILGKASAISMLVRGYIPFEPDPEPDPGE